jgi:hypothetical protein
LTDLSIVVERTHLVKPDGRSRTLTLTIPEYITTSPIIIKTTTVARALRKIFINYLLIMINKNKPYSNGPIPISNCSLSAI